MEIFTFLYHANEESYDFIGGSTKTVQHSVQNISRNIKAASILQTWYQKCTAKKKENETRRAFPMTTVMPLILFSLRLKFPGSILNKDHPLPTI